MKNINTLLKYILTLFLFTAGVSYSQVLYFCESVDKDGDPVNHAERFTINSNGGYLDLLVQMDNEVGVNSVYYKIYEVKNGKEVYDNTIWQDVEPDWTWFWKQITFYNDGTYNIYVYDEDGNFLASNTIQIAY
ncbi:MAG TPA: hypothetical protein VMT35_19095, partial [Ignavibacteriaceae bacterium]|nr:hypothetical protein [Ignavibacteriaceae bacterium]